MRRGPITKRRWRTFTARNSHGRQRYLPSVAFNADYAAAGAVPAGSASQVYDARGSLTIPIFQGRTVRGEILQADARLDALRIFFYADRETKIARLKARGKSQEEAEDLVDHVDLERADYIRKYFGVDWPTRTTYHAMINTAIGDEAAISVITGLMAAMVAAETPPAHV
jgi:hypothetical protein